MRRVLVVVALLLVGLAGWFGNDWIRGRFGHARFAGAHLVGEGGARRLLVLEKGEDPRRGFFGRLDVIEPATGRRLARHLFDGTLMDVIGHDGARIYVTDAQVGLEVLDATSFAVLWRQADVEHRNPSAGELSGTSWRFDRARGQLRCESRRGAAFAVDPSTLVATATTDPPPRSDRDAPDALRRALQSRQRAAAKSESSFRAVQDACAGGVTTFDPSSWLVRGLRREGDFTTTLLERLSDTGAPRWSHPLPESWSDTRVETASLAGDLVLVTLGRGADHVVALDAATGAERWRFPAN